MLLLAATLALVIPQDGPLSPRAYVSSSGRAELFVTPGERTGAGPARYELRRDGARAWSGERGLTFRDAVVGDGGAAAGYGYTEGLGCLVGGELVLALLSPAGELTRLDALPRTSSSFDDACHVPVANGVFLHADVVVFRIADPDLNRQSETWMRYRFPSGDALPALDPKAVQPDAERLLGVFGAEPVPGTPFALVHWLLCDGNDIGARFALIDLDGVPAWSLDLPADYVARTAFEVQRDGALLATDAPAAFALRHAGAGLRVDYAVERGDAGRWAVREVARAAWADPRYPLPLDGPIPALALEHAGTLALDAPGPGVAEPIEASAPAEEGEAELEASDPLARIEDVGRVAAVALGPADRVAALSERTGVVHVLAADGEVLHRCVPDADDVPAGGCPTAALTVADDGRVLVDYLGDGARHVAFASDGEREGLEAAAVGPGAWHALPDGGLLVLGGDVAWVLPDEPRGVEEPDESGEPGESNEPGESEEPGERVEIRRGHDGTWLRDVHAAAVAPDGSFVLVDLPPAFAEPAAQRVKLHAYAPGGEPRATLAIPGHATGLVRPSVAWDGLRIALGIEGRVLLLDAEGVPLGELVIDAAPADARPLLPREAEELWLFDHEGAIQRYALPR